jgi:DHA2 family multidrug resistance protein
MTSVTPQETAAASGLINFLRTIAGAIATAVTISAWSTEAVTARSHLVDRLNASHELMARLQDQGLGVNQALHSLDGLVQSQSIMLATNHVFLSLGTVVALTAVGVWLMPRPAN